MPHLAPAQLGALWLSCVGWALTAVALGLVQWRVWRVPDGVVSSGVAWVGLWRACFHSHAVVSPGFRVTHCRRIGAGEAFAPPEIVAGQALMLLSVLLGLCGNAGAAYAMRNVYFGMGKSPRSRAAFPATGALCLLAAAAALVPLLWNLSSVVNNRTIGFPPEFHMPPAPDSQHAGSGLAVGVAGSLLMVVAGVVFCSYRCPATGGGGGGGALPSCPGGRENPGFHSQEPL